MIRVRHYTSISGMAKILADQRIVARDQNRVFMELARTRKSSAADAEDKYGLHDGRGKAHVEFDMDDDRLASRRNPLFDVMEWFVIGDIDLSGRNAVGAKNT